MEKKIEMEDAVIKFETAKLAKEKGCDIKGCVLVYDTEGKQTLDIGINNEVRGYNNECYKAYTQSLLQKWLRDIHHIQIEHQARQVEHDVYVYKVWIYSNLVEKEEEDDKLFYSYEEALEDALYECLKLIP